MNDIPIRGISCRIKQKTLIIKSITPLKIISSAVLNPDLEETRTIINHQISRTFNSRYPQKYLKDIAINLGLNPSTTVGLMTAVNVQNYVVKSLKEGSLEVTAIVTGGASNPATAGENIVKKGLGTINIVVLTNACASKGCFVNIVQTVAEAKTIAMRELDIRSPFSKRLATGTTSDAVIVGSTLADKHTIYAGTATRLGKLVGRTVLEAVKEAIQKYPEFISVRPLRKRLEEHGIQFDDLIKTWKELYLHHPSMGKIKDVTKLAVECFEQALSDCNVASLILAGLKLEEQGISDLIPGLGKGEFKRDPVNLIADELLGLSIANYIAGSRGIFEFYRFDRLKPGLLKKLGPFTDDVIGGLVGGVSSAIYTRILDKQG